MSPLSSSSESKPIAISMGDPSGIGPETIVQLYLNEPHNMHQTMVIGDVAHMRRAAQVIRSHTPVPVWVLDSIGQVTQVPKGCIPVLQVALDKTVASSKDGGLSPWREVNAIGGAWAGRSVVVGASLCLQGQAAALVTAPLHKESLFLAGYDFPGHTELLQALSAKHLGLKQLAVRMMLVNSELRTVLLSIHVSLREALAVVTPENLLQTLDIAHKALSVMLGRAPKIAVAGLNPHAGEGGRFGQEEIAVIAPTIAKARAEGLNVHGPIAPDTIFMRARQGAFDVVVALYHDQGLIPIKYLGLEHGVNVTLGLPMVRTSPDHGTAFDLAGTGKASPDSLRAALELARQFSAAQKEYELGRESNERRRKTYLSENIVSGAMQTPGV